MCFFFKQKNNVVHLESNSRWIDNRTASYRFMELLENHYKIILSNQSPYVISMRAIDDDSIKIIISDSDKEAFWSKALTVLAETFEKIPSDQISYRT